MLLWRLKSEIQREIVKNNVCTFVKYATFQFDNCRIYVSLNSPASVYQEGDKGPPGKGPVAFCLEAWEWKWVQRHMWLFTGSKVLIWPYVTIYYDVKIWLCASKGLKNTLQYLMCSLRHLWVYGVEVINSSSTTLDAVFAARGAVLLNHQCIHIPVYATSRPAQSSSFREDATIILDCQGCPLFYF